MAKKPIQDDDIELFRQAVADTTPLRSLRIVPPAPKRAPVARQSQQDDDAISIDMLFGEFDPVELDADEQLSYRRTGLPTRQFAKLRRGQFTIEAQLDLHGYTRDKAKTTLSAFLQRCQRQNQCCVRIVHGKGRGSPQRKPVLKAYIAYWLLHWDPVMAYCSARNVDGGTGALYVLLKKQRES